MTEQPKARFNPNRFSDALTEDRYRKGITGGALGVRRQERVEWLRKKHEDDKGSPELAEKLASCQPNHRCLSPACPECSFAFRALITEVAHPYLLGHTDRNKIVCVSVVPADGTILPGQLSVDQHVRNMRRWKERLGRAEVTSFLGATDWSFNHHAQDRYEPHWLEHFYGFTVTDDLEGLKRNLRAQFPRTDAIPRPVTVKPWDGRKRALHYMAKSNFFRGIGTDEGQRSSGGGVERQEYRTTDKQPLRSQEQFDLLVHLDQIGMQSRLLMRWLQFVHLKEGWVIADRSPRGRMHGKARGWGKSTVS